MGRAGRTDQRHTFRSLAALAALVTVAAIVMPVDGLGPRWCPFYNVTGLPCPFCGATRAAALAAHGRWSAAIVLSPLGALCLAASLLLLCGFALRVFFPLALRGAWARAEGLMSGKARLGLYAALAIVAANWLYLLAGH